MRRTFVVSTLAMLSGLCAQVRGQDQANGPAWAAGSVGAESLPEPRREFRAAWVATVANIDWPSNRLAPAAEQRAEMIRILDALKSARFNAVIFQARPACDALYKSSLEPWSEFLTGESGKPPAPINGQEWDPLTDWITEAHARGMELHVWVNPFRARHFDSKRPDAATHISKTHPHLVKSYDRFLWLDPGEPEAEGHTFRVIADILTRYDVDGVHIDDYFYPYPKGNDPFPDDPSWERKLLSAAPGQAPVSKGDWRRDNINRFVRRLYDTTHSIKPRAKVGVSPFGIYRPDMPPGVKGMDAYEKLFADARLWLREGWCDYWAPQLYWKVEAPQQPFVPLLNYWNSENLKGRAMWPGLYASRLLKEENDKLPVAQRWWTDDIVRQVGLIREMVKTGPGEIHFSAKAIASDASGIRTTLAAGPYAAPALTPAMPWLDREPPRAPIVSMSDQNEAVRVSWTPGDDEPLNGWWIAAQSGAGWSTVIAPPQERTLTLTGGRADTVVIRAVDRAGNLGVPAIMSRGDRRRDH